ncbi:MAG: hypothetical protein NTY45_05885 [Elusimicrobia bacterium]|nr:hypothetical protein [Elusimicrobiota bacterium]
MKNLLTILLLAAIFPAPVPAAGPKDAAAAEKTNPFSDPVFQDYVETAAGYLDAANVARKPAGDLRDALAAPALPTLKNPLPVLKSVPAASPPAERPEAAGAPLNYYKVTFAGEGGPLGSHVWPLDANPGRYAREYVFLSVVPTEQNYDALLARLETEAGFRFSGEKTYFFSKSKQTVILGWAPYASLSVIMKVKGVAKVSVEKKSAGVPLKTKVCITLKVPFQNKPNAFVPEFIRTIGKNNNFDTENWFRLPNKSADSKFSVFNVTGTLPVDMVGEISRSPFVAAVEFKDSSL